MSKLQNLAVPFNLPIPGGMTIGKKILIQGNIPSMSERFAVNLLTHSGNIAFHLCPIFKENRVVRNNVLNMNWGPEESHGSMPLYPGGNFEILILCEPYNFKVAFNGRHFCEFDHRVPFNTISNLAVDGDVIIHNVNFNGQNVYGSNNNGFSNSVPSYGFQPGSASNNFNTGGLYPSVDSYPYPAVPSTRRSPSPGVHYNPNPGPPSYPNPSGPAYPSAGGGTYPQNPSLYPTQPSYPGMPHQGPYPQIPNSNPGGVSPTPHSKPGFLDQAGAALAGVLGPSLLAGGMNKNSSGYGKPNLLDEAGKALAGVIGGAGLAGTGKTQKGTQPQVPTHQSGFLGQAGSALAGILGGTDLIGGTSRSQRGGIPLSPTRPAQRSSILDQAGSALAGILGNGGLAGAGRSQRGVLPLNPARQPQSNLLDQTRSVLSDLLGGDGSSVRVSSIVKFFQHHNRNKMGILGGALGTAVAGAALTGHLNPIKATKKQLKAQKKALKYGLPIAGAGLGAYALHKGLKKGFRRSSSSSSSSSSD